MEVGHLTDSFGSTPPTISERGRKLFPGMGWFAGNIDRIRQDDDGNIYEVLFKDGYTEEWRQEEYYKNAADTCIPIGDVGFMFIMKFSGGSFFGGRVVGIQSNDKRKCNFDEGGDIRNYKIG